MRDRAPRLGMIESRIERRPEVRECVCLELPLNVKNIDKAIAAVGGEQTIARVTAESAYSTDRKGLELRLRNDPFHHPLESVNVNSDNIVLEIEIPHSKASITDAEIADVRTALASAKRDNLPFHIRPLLHITSVHRFCGIADFQYYTGDSLFVQKMNNSLFSGNLADIQDLHLKPNENENLESQHADILPPPRFALNTQPFYYGYKQTPNVKIVNTIDGKRELVNVVSSARVVSNIINWGDPVPCGPPTGLDLSSRSAVLVCIKELEKLFTKRASYTRRGLQHELGSVTARHLKYALPYVAYYYRSGPWRGAYIRYGIDPAINSEMARYQVEHFRISSEDTVAQSDDTKKVNDLPSSEAKLTFDGSTYPDAPMLQLCDIADGVLESYIDTKTLRENVDINDGWYMSDTIGVIRKVLRSELMALKEEKQPLSIERRQKLLYQILESQRTTF